MSFHLILLISCIIAIQCKKYREPKCGDTKHFRFDSELPTYHEDLSSCLSYRGETCCNRSHTDKIVKNIYAFAQPNVTEQCRNIGLNIGCSPCDPRVGTKKMEGICHSYCDLWYNACKDDYFHFNKRGILTACSESDIVCSQLSTITNNGSRLCELSGFDVSYISIKCYNGDRPKLKYLPTKNQRNYVTPFEEVYNALKKTNLWKNIKLLTRRYNRLKVWQQILVIAGFAYFFFAFFKVFYNVLIYLFYGTEQETSTVPTNVFNEDEREKIRKQRLKYLKDKMMSDSMNMEAKLAKELGMKESIKNDDEDDDQGYTAEHESEDEDRSFDD